MDKKIRTKNEIINKLISIIEKDGFLLDSDNTDREMDRITKDVILKNFEEEIEDDYNEIFDEIYEMVREYFKDNYKVVGSVNSRADYTGYFYLNKYNFETVEELEKFFKLNFDNEE